MARTRSSEDLKSSRYYEFLESGPVPIGLVTLLAVLLGGILIDQVQKSFTPHYNPGSGNWFSIGFCSLAAAFVSGFSVKQVLRLNAQALAESRERERVQGELKHLLSSVRCVLWHAQVEEVDGEFLWETRVSQEEAAAKVIRLNIPAGEAFVDVWYRSKLKEDSIQCDANAIRAFRTGSPGYTNEYRCILENGEVCWFYEDVQIERLGKNRYYVIGACVDITELKAVEEKLDAERVMLRTLIDSLPDPIFVKDSKSRIVLENSAWLQQVGAEHHEEVVGKTDFDYFPIEFAQPFFEDEQEIIRTGVPLLTRTESSVGHDGQKKWYWTTKVPLRDSQGRITGIVGVNRDITVRKREEEELRTALHDVEEARQLAEQNSKLLEVQKEDLAEARDQALASTRAKSEFLANMSHEIRTPMNGILGITELMLGTPLTSDQRELAKTIRSSADALLTVINDILDFSRIEAGKMQIDLTDFNLRSVMEEVTDLVASSAFRKNLEVACLFPSNVPEYLQGDPARIRQVLTNLMGNAVKFTEKGEVRLEANVLAETEREVKVRIGVIDTGIGIPQDAQSKIFESFTQADGSTTRRFGGTGLGLTISRHLTELMGGRIGVTSEPGKGSEFFIELTLAKQLQPVSHVPLPMPELMNGLRVLVVDDNETNRKVLHEQLASWGCIPEHATSGQIGLEMLSTATEKGTPFQVGILDMQMPEMDGEQLASKITGNDAIQKLPLILYTSIGERGTLEEMREKGFSAVLLKPARQSQLFNVILSVLDGSNIKDRNALEVSLASRPALNVDVLLAEDNDINQMVAQMMLDRFGCRTTLADTGKKALEAMSYSTFDVILMDVHMPDMDGYQATVAIRELGQHQSSRIPIIGMTAKAMPGDREIAINAGMDDYIVKPVRPDELYEMLRKWGTHAPQSHQSAR